MPETEEDIELKFVTERCERGYDYRVQAQHLYDAYVAWCKDNGIWRKNMNKVALDWNRLGLKRGATNGVHFWYGIRLIDQRDGNSAQ